MVARAEARSQREGLRVTRLTEPTWEEAG
jgi:hypothetical protein